MKKSRIKEFLETYCDEVYNMPDHALELLMDNHKCINWMGQEYFVPENNSFYTQEDKETYDYLIKNFSL